MTKSSNYVSFIFQRGEVVIIEIFRVLELINFFKLIQAQQKRLQEIQQQLALIQQQRQQLQEQQRQIMLQQQKKHFQKRIILQIFFQIWIKTLILMSLFIHRYQ